MDNTLLYYLYGGSGKPVFINASGSTETLEARIASIEVRIDNTEITELYEEGNDTNLITEMGLDGLALKAGVDIITNGVKGFSKVIIADGGSIKCNIKS